MVVVEVTQEFVSRHFARLMAGLRRGERFVVHGDRGTYRIFGDPDRCVNLSWPMYPGGPWHPRCQAEWEADGAAP